MGWADCIVLGMAPLGIITAIVAAIRVGGPSWLKAIIGRARESRAIPEAELMSSTSREVCELWNGHEIVRIMGEGPIREFIILLPEDKEEGETNSESRPAGSQPLSGVPASEGSESKAGETQAPDSQSQEGSEAASVSDQETVVTTLDDYNPYLKKHGELFRALPSIFWLDLTRHSFRFPTELFAQGKVRWRGPGVGER